MFAIQEIFPTANTVQRISRCFVELDEIGLWLYFSVQALLFYALLFFIIFHVANARKDSLNQKGLLYKLLISDVTFIIFIWSFIMMSRVPLSMTGQQNPDEATWVAIAKTLTQDMRFWLSVDTGTGGPLVPLMLTPLKIFGLPIDQGTTKLVGSFIMAISTSALYLFLSKIVGKNIGRITILPLVVAVSAMTYFDLIAYNSEHMVILVLSCALVFFGRLIALGPGKLNHNVVLLALLLGLMPFAKLQGAPLALFIGIVAIYILFKRKLFNRLPILVGVSLIPTIFVVIFTWSYGALSYFWLSYVKGNLVYASRNAIADGVFSNKMFLLFKLILSPPELTFFFYYSFAAILFGLIVILSLNKNWNLQFFQKIGFGIILFLIDIYCVTAPNNYFPHYTLLLLVPLTLLVGIVLNTAIELTVRQREKDDRGVQLPAIRAIFVAVFIAGTSFYYFQRNFTFRPSYFDRGVTYADGYGAYPNLLAVLKHYYSPGERMSVWGWTCSLYDGTEYLMGTRYSATQSQIEGGPLQSFFTQCYLEDLDKNKPLIFVETIGPGFFAYQDRLNLGYENYPQVKNYIDANYEYDSEIDGARLFVQKTKIRKPWIHKGIDKTPNANTEFIGYLDSVTKNGSFIKFSGWTALGSLPKTQEVQLALFNNADTLLVNSFQVARKDVVMAYNNWNWLYAGYSGYIPIEELKESEYQLGLLIQNNEKVCFKNLGAVLKKEDFVD